MIEELLETLDGHVLETRLCSIILELVDADPLCDDAEVLLHQPGRPDRLFS